MQINNLKRNTKNKSTVIVGRGGKRGKTSGRGGKGQTARAGHKVRPEVRDLIKRIPKLRGYAFKSFKSKPILINVGDLNILFSQGDVVNHKSLASLGVVNKISDNKSKIKILAGGEIDKKIIVDGCLVSEEAKKKIEKAGGKIK